MIALQLVFPVERDGRTFSVINVRRPGPLAFARYWLHRDKIPYPVGIIDVPVEVADALNRIDLDRVMAAAAKLTRPYLTAIAICQVLIRTRSLHPTERT